MPARLPLPAASGYNPARMDAEPFYRKPWFGTLAGAVLLTLAYLWALNAASLLRPGFTLLIDAVLFVAALLTSAALASQFVLPVRSLNERRQALARLLAYLLGQHGPVTFVDNGRLARQQGEDRNGPGVAFVDPASAAVLRTATRFTRAIGPGTTFTAPGERLAEAIDVRRQMRTLPGQRPRAGDPPEATSSLALTADGVVLSADLGVTFMLDPGHNLAPREGRSPQLPPYEVNLQAAERAAYGHAYGDGDREDLPWTELPLRLVVDVWREEVKRHRLDDLINAHSDDPAPVEKLQAAIEARLCAAPGPGAATSAQSKELQVLAARGIRVLSVSVGNLFLPDRLQEQRMDRWRQEWLANASSRPPADRSASPGTPWSLLTRSLRAELDAGGSPDLDRTLQLILSDAVDVADRTPDPAERQRFGADLRSIAVALGASTGNLRPVDTGGGP